MEEEEIQLFTGVIFQFDISIPANRKKILKEKLMENGAILREERQHLHVTHYISNNKPRSTILADHIVLPIWIEAALRNGFLHDPKFYYPDSTKILRGVVVTCDGLPQRDNEAIYGTALALGGQYRTGMRNDVTHLVCLAPEGSKYEMAIGPLRNRVKVVLPHWFDECAKLRRYISEDNFLFPYPKYLYPSGIHEQIASNKSSDKSTGCSSNELSTAELLRMESSLSSGNASLKDDIKISAKMIVDKSKDAFDRKSMDNNDYLQYEHTTDKQLVHPLPDIEQLEKLTPKETYLHGHTIFIHPEVIIKPKLRACLFTYLAKAGASITNIFNQDTTIVILKYRTSDEYRIAYSRGLIVASLLWLTNTFYRQCLLPPLTTIWDYPVPKGGIPGMEKMLITISGYESEPRTLLYRLCCMVGAKWAPNLESATTHLICSKKGSEKYKAAKSRNCVILNHLWLEECYQQWICKSVADSRYTYFPENDVLQSIVGKTPLLEQEIERWRSIDSLPMMVPFVPLHELYEDAQMDDKTVDKKNDNNKLDKGKVAVRGPRKAAMDASTHLRDVLVPDMNQYNKEKKTYNNSNSNNSNDKNKRQRSLTPIASKDSDIEYKKLKLSTSSSKTRYTSNQASLTTSTSIEKNENNSISLERNDLADDNEDNDNEGSITDSDKQKASNDYTEINSKEEKEKEKALTVQPPTKIAFSGGVVLTNAENKSVKKLGCTITENIREASHLVVTDKIIRTPKFLCAINLGIIIVTFDWIKQSIKQQSWCDPLEYLLNDQETESQYEFTLYQSLLTAQHYLLGVDEQGGKKDAHGTWLQGYDVCMIHSAKGSALKEVVESAGGKWITLSKQQALNEANSNLLLLANKADAKKNWSDFTKKNIKIYNTDAVVIGTFRQRLELEDYILA